MALSGAYGVGGASSVGLLVVTKSGKDWSTLKESPSLLLLAPSSDVQVLVTGWYRTADGPVFAVAGDVIELPKKPSTQAMSGPWT